MAMRYKFNLSTCIQKTLVIGRRGCVGRDLKGGNVWLQITDASSPVRKQSRTRAM